MGDPQAAHNAWIDSLIARFQRELEGIVHSAQARTLARLMDLLSVTDGKLDRGVKNGKALRRLDAIFLEEMDRAGYQHLLTETVSQFPGQLPFFQEALEQIAAATKGGLPPVKFTPRDLQLFTDQALSAKDGLDSTMEVIAARAKNKILLSFGGMKFVDLAETLAGVYSKGIAEATGLAETATATYYAVMADRGFQIIQKDHPGPLRYKYDGPDDKLTRPFCHHLEVQTRAGKTWSRADIDGMDNGQIGNVFVSRGGWRCRHQWLLAI